jgi:hypothetical protein
MLRPFSPLKFEWEQSLRILLKCLLVRGVYFNLVVLCKTAASGANLKAIKLYKLPRSSV